MDGFVKFTYRPRAELIGRAKMNLKLAMKLAVVAVLSGGLVVACAPKKNRSHGHRAGPSADTIQTILKKTVGDSYKIDDEQNMRFASRFAGASLEMDTVVTDKKEEVTASTISLQATLKNPLDVVKAKGEVRFSSEFGVLEVSDYCGRKIENYEVQARCLGKSCDGVLVMLMEKIDKKVEGGEIALIFRRPDAKHIHALSWSANGNGNVAVSGPIASAEQSLVRLIDPDGDSAAQIDAKNRDCQVKAQDGASAGKLNGLQERTFKEAPAAAPEAAQDSVTGLQERTFKASVQEEVVGTKEGTVQTSGASKTTEDVGVQQTIERLSPEAVSELLGTDGN